MWGDGKGEAGGGGRHLERRELLARLRRRSRDRGRHWIRVHRPAMACRFQVTLASEDAPLVPAARAALDEVDLLESRLSLFRETSELVRVNREAAGRPVPVTEGLFDLLLLCRSLHGATGGAFDPTSTPLSRCWGFLAREGRRPTPGEIESARSRVGMEHVVLDEKARTVAFTAPGVELNLGSIGKGWALDHVAAGLRAHGLGRALVSAGGSSLLGWGGEAWTVSLRPRRELLGELRLRRAALGTSSAGEQRFEIEGRRFGHVIDPRTGEPAEGVRSAAAVADDAATADALTTALLVGGPGLAEDYSRKSPGTVVILVLDEDPQTLRIFGGRTGVEIDPGPDITLAAGSR